MAEQTLKTSSTKENQGSGDNDKSVSDSNPENSKNIITRLISRFEKDLSIIFYIFSITLILLIVGLINNFANFTFIAIIVSFLIFLLIVGLTKKINTDTEAIHVLRFGYSFAIAIMIGCLYMIFGKLTIYTVGSQSGTNDHYSRYMLAILPGCDYSRSPENNTLVNDNNPRGRLANMPEGADYCGNIPPQWVLSIGGLVLNCHVDGSCHNHHKSLDDSNQHRKPKLQNCSLATQDHGCSKKQLVTHLNSKESQIEAVRKTINKFENQLKLAEMLPANHPDRAQRIYQSTEKLKAIRESKHQLGEEIKHLKEQVNSAIEFEKSEKDAKDIARNIVPARPIVGGIVVPIYFLALAIIGAIVAMLRKLPEFQLRIDEKYEENREKLVLSGEKPADPLPPSQVQELVIFQMLQVLTAAPIAVVAFAWVTPESLANSIILAFAAGFSSEVILVAVRKLTDTLVSKPPTGLRYDKVRERVRKELLETKPTMQSRISLRGTSVATGDRVEFAQEIGTHPAGTKAVIELINNGELTVRIDDSENTITKPFSFFKPEGRPAAPIVSLSPVG